MVYVFGCRQSSKQTSQETEVLLSWVKRSCLSVVIDRFRSINLIHFICFQGSLAVTIIVIDGSQKCNHQLGFELQSLHVIEKCNNQVTEFGKVKTN